MVKTYKHAHEHTLTGSGTNPQKGKEFSNRRKDSKGG